ncbi:zinc finger protein 431-like [Chionomys nivalis]|uniref:zinc finger protein 431-like n=2 Tax=Chionomys nivalis TaxID=269649 RepID=UPI002593DFAB|nr:zinc finger protein 431-like [Chionomys nivalis]XP_057641850.1 zinc finger protein 431-like [Chionomys nivalis]
MAAVEKNAVTYYDVHVNFTWEEWTLLNPSQKSLYKDVMLETYRNLTTIGYNWEDHNIEEHCECSRIHERYHKSMKKESQTVNSLWKPYICYSSFTKYIICSSGYKPHEYSDVKKYNIPLSQNK